MELIGMAIGSIFLGGVADRIGRRPTMLGCLVVMAVGMLMATTVRGLVDLSIWRVVTGLGIGGMLAAINAVAAEFSNTRRRDSERVADVDRLSGRRRARRPCRGAAPARQRDWRSVFYFGAARDGAADSRRVLRGARIGALARAQAAGGRARADQSAHCDAWDMRRCTALPEVSAVARKRSVAEIFAPGLVAIDGDRHAGLLLPHHDLLLHREVDPEDRRRHGLRASSAAGVLVWTNVGGATGGAVFGLLTLRFGLKPLTIVLLVLSTVMVTLFGRSPADLQRLSLICAAGRLLHQRRHRRPLRDHRARFPTHVRAFGTGFTVGVGRGGSVLAPIIAGFLFTAGYSLPTVALTMASGSLLAAGVLLMLKLGDRPVVPARIVRCGRRCPSPVLPDETKRHAHPHDARRQPDSSCRSARALEGVEGIRGSAGTIRSGAALCHG